MNWKVWAGVILVWCVSSTPSTTAVSSIPSTTAVFSTPSTTAEFSTPSTTAVSSTPSTTAVSSTPSTTAVFSTPSATITNINNSLSIVIELGDFIVVKDFNNVIRKLAAGVNPYLGNIGPFVSFIMEFLGKSESAELRASKRLFEEIDNRFDQGSSEVIRKLAARVTPYLGIIGPFVSFIMGFPGLSKSAELRAPKRLLEDMKNINAVNSDFENIYKLPTEDVHITTYTFVSNYERIYDDDGTKLYNSIMQDLFSSAIRNTEYDRRESQAYMLDILKLLLKAAKLEQAYYQLKGNIRAVHRNQNLWQIRFTNIANKMESTDREIVSQYHTQSRLDIDNYSTRHPASGMGNYEFNNGLYDFLSRKYYWRDWLTVTYKPIWGFDVHTIGTCGNSYTKFRSNGRNIVVSSVDNSKRYIDLDDARSFVYSVLISTHSEEAYETFPFLGCSPYVAKGVICYPDRYDVQLKSAENRSLYRNEGEFSFIFVFG